MSLKEQLKEIISEFKGLGLPILAITAIIGIEAIQKPGREAREQAQFTRSLEAAGISRKEVARYKTVQDINNDEYIDYEVWTRSEDGTYHSLIVPSYHKTTERTEQR